MASKKIRRILKGNKSKYTYFGRIGCSHSMYGGGFNNFIYGIKGIIALQVYHGWGDFIKEKFDNQ